MVSKKLNFLGEEDFLLYGLADILSQERSLQSSRLSQITHIKPTSKKFGLEVCSSVWEVFQNLNL